MISLCQLITHIEADTNTETVRQIVSNMQGLLVNLRVIVCKWNDYLEDYDTGHTNVQSRHRQARGRPRYSIGKQQIEYLRSMYFSWTEISEMFGVSYMTIYRRRMEYGISGSRGRDIDDAQLTEIITDMRREQREVGQTMMWAHVRSLGYQVTRTRIRECIHRINPISSAFRWRNMTPRRPYSVPSPNSLWHLGK